MLTKLHTNPSKFFWGRPKKKLEGFEWSFLSITGLRSQRQFADRSLNFYVMYPSFLFSQPLMSRVNNFANFERLFSSLRIYDVSVSKGAFTDALTPVDHKSSSMIKGPNTALFPGSSLSLPREKERSFPSTIKTETLKQV